MGAGASAHDMYASAGDDTAESQLRSLLPPGAALPAALLGDLKEYNFLVDAIAMDDAVLLSDAIVSDHRNYDKLSERLLTKTRGQLQRTRRMYSASSALSSGKNKELLPDLQSMFQGQYGAFLSNLFRTKDEYNVHQLETALSGLGCDEDLIIDVLCASPPHEFAAIQAAVNAEGNETFGPEVFEGKLLKGSVLQRFVLKLLGGPRNEEGRLSDAAAVAKQVAELMEFKKMIDVDGALDLLCAASRSECEAINKKLYLMHFITLPAYIKAVVPNETAARALTLWTLPPRRAALHALHHGIYGTAYHADDHSVAVCRLVSAQDKRDIGELREEYRKVYNKDVFDEMQIYLAGNIKSALEIFVTQPVFDNDFERSMIRVVHEAAQGEVLQQVGGLLDEEIQHLRHYRGKSEAEVAQAKMRLLNSSQPSPRARMANRGLALELGESSMPPIAAKMTPIRRSPTKRSFLSPELPGPIETEIDEDLLPPNFLPYLVDLYDAMHPNEEGQIPVETFWKMIIDDVFRHAFTDYDVNRLKKKFKAEAGDGMVAWKDAISYLTVQINIMKSEKKDLWLGLKMVTPGPERWFWFNVRDEMSFWMTAEEQMQFKQCLALPREQQPAKWLLPSAFRNVVEEKPKAASATNKSARRKRRSTFGEIDTPTAASLARSVAPAKTPSQQRGKKGESPLGAAAATPSGSRQASQPAGVPSIAEHSPPQPQPEGEAPQTEQAAPAEDRHTESAKEPSTSPSKIPYKQKYAAESFG